MQITFLIGNGFDIGLGLSSRFLDFFPIYYCESRDKPDRIRRLSDEIGKDFETWSDFEIALGGYTEKFTTDTKTDLIDQLRDFESSFVDYLEERELILDYKDTALIKSVMEKALRNFYSPANLSTVSSETINSVFNLKSGETPIFNFINFNYTKTLEKCVNIFKMHKDKNLRLKIGSIINIHGKCDFYPIIGVNDKSQIKNKSLANDVWFTSRFVKPKINDLLENRNNQKATSLISNSTIIVVYGMSIGKTDKKWWETIIKWLATNGNNHLIIFDYDENYQTTFPFDYIDKKDHYLATLKSMLTQDSFNIESLRDRIHIAIHKNIFSMDLMKKTREMNVKALEELKEKLATAVVD